MSLKESAGCFATAIRFLTILPVRYQADKDGDRFEKSLFFFPFVGLLIGGLGFALFHFLLALIPAEVLSVLAVMYLAVITGGLHLDGLADSGDGLLSSRPRQESLRIMKDSRIGAMGVIVLIMVLLMKLSGIQEAGMQLPLGLLFIPVGGRCAILITMARVPYARSEGGIGSLFYSTSSRKCGWWAFFFLICLPGLIEPGFLPFLLLGVLLTCFLFNRWCIHRLGGATGDTLGAVCEITEAVIAVVWSLYIMY